MNKRANVTVVSMVVVLAVIGSALGTGAKDLLAGEALNRSGRTTSMTPGTEVRAGWLTEVRTLGSEGMEFQLEAEDGRSDGSCGANVYYQLPASRDSVSPLINIGGHSVKGSAPAAYNQAQASMAFDGTNYFVVWTDLEDICGTRVGCNGTVLDTLKIRISTSSGSPAHPSVSFDGASYLVVWMDDQGGDYDIYGARVSPDGSVLDSSGISISTDIYDQAHPSVSFDGANYLIVWMDNRGGDYDIYGTRVSPDGSVIDSSGIAISTAVYDQAYPDVAFDGSNYLVVWQDARDDYGTDIYGTRIGADGVVLDPAGIQMSFDAYDDSNPTLVFGSTAYLVVWDTTYDIYGARVGIDGDVLDTLGITISTEAHNQLHPDLTFDGANYLVVWQDDRSNISELYGELYKTDIYGTLVSHEGTVLNSVGFVICAETDTQAEPAVGCDGSNSLVVWTDERDPSHYYDEDIYGTIVAPDGEVLNPSGGAISIGGTNTQYSPAVAFDGLNYLVVWQDNRSGTFDIYGTLVSEDGIVLDTLGIPVAVAAGEQTLPAIAFNGTNYLVVWVDGRDGVDKDIYGARVSLEGNLLDTSGIPICVVAGDQGYPSVASDGIGYIVVWHDNHISPSYDIYASRVDEDGSVLDPAGIPICTASRIQAFPAVAFDGVNYLAVWSDDRTLSISIFGARVAVDGSVLDAAGIQISSSGYSDLQPEITADGTNYLVLWTRPLGWYNAAYAARVSAAGNVLDYPSAILIDNERPLPHAAFGMRNYLVVRYGIYASRMSTDGTILDYPGFLINGGREAVVSYAFPKQFLVAYAPHHIYGNFYDEGPIALEPDGSGDFPTIQAAVNAARTGQIIELANGVYSGNGNVNIDFGGKNLRLQSQSGMPDQCTIDCAGTGRGFYLHSGEDTSSFIEGITITNGYAVDNGGAVYCDSASPQITNCVIVESNAGHRGGGIYCSGGSPLVTDCFISMNTAGSGGGIYCSRSDSLEIFDCVITGNSADYGYPYRGGGAVAVSRSSASFKYCTMSGNWTASDGGAVSSIGDCVLEFDGCTISANEASLSGGGVYCDSLCNMTFQQSILWGNCSGVTGNQLFISDAGSAAGFSCCAADSSGVGGLGAASWVTGNIFFNPQFCNPMNCADAPGIGGDYYLRIHSPCAPFSEPNPECALIGCLPVQCDSCWAGLTSEPLGDPGDGMGVAMADYDDDGDTDMYITNFGTANKLLRNDNGGFVDFPSPALNDVGYSSGAAWGDFDTDGDLDLYLANNGANRLFRNDDSLFVDVTASPLDDSGQGMGVTWGDYDNDGDLDLYLVNYDGANRLFRNDGSGIFAAILDGPLGDSGNGRGAASGDFDNDGDLDIYLINQGGNRLLRNDGAVVFTDITTLPLDDAGNGMGAVWGDYDNDCDLDLYLVNYEGGNKLFRNDGFGAFVDLTVSPITDAIGGGMGAAWVDYESDGDLDLYLAKFSRSNKLFRNDGNGCFVDATDATLGHAGADRTYDRSVGCSDYDNDGSADLYVVSSGENTLFRNSCALSQWLHVELIGTNSNSYGVGARIRVVSEGRSQIREICGGGGYLSNDPLRAEFGLAYASVVDTIEILWPSGIVQDTTDVAPCQVLSMTEPDTSSSAVESTSEWPREHNLYPILPSPFTVAAVIRYDVRQPTELNLSIYDVAGRLVRVLTDTPLAEPGSYTLVWDGRNVRGGHIAPGVYFCRMAAGNYMQTERIVLLR